MTSHLNRRVVGRRVFAFRNINLRLAFQNPAHGGVDVVLVRSAEKCSLQQIASLVWKTLLLAHRGESNIERDRQKMRSLPSWGFHWLLAFYRWLDRHWALPTVGRLDNLRCSAVLVNDLSFRNAPPMRCYKPTRFPDESISINITLGPMEEKVVVRDGQPVAGTVAPLFVRVDHAWKPPMLLSVNPLCGELPTGEPYAGEPHVRFGGRGGRTQSVVPTPIFGRSVVPAGHGPLDEPFRSRHNGERVRKGAAFLLTKPIVSPS